MEDSTTYQAIIRKGKAEGKLEGKLEGVREVLNRVGSLRYGMPDPETEALLNSITSIEQLELLAEGLFKAESWKELLTL